MVAKVMLKQGYKEGKGLGTKLQGIVEPMVVALREGVLESDIMGAL